MGIGFTNENKISGKKSNLKIIVNIFFFLSIAFLIWIISDKFQINKLFSFGPIIAIGVAYSLFRKYGDIEFIDKPLRKIFNSSIKVKIVLSFLLLISSLALMVLYNSADEKLLDNRSFSGNVYNGKSEPLDSVIILLQEFHLIDTTDSFGRFSFENLDTNYTTISIIARKEGYITYKAEGSVGNNNYNFIMSKK